MPVDWSIYALADPVFFETPQRKAGQESLIPPQFTTMPAGWRQRYMRFWRSYTPPVPHDVTQGWKIHASATMAHADRILEIVAGLCLEEEVAFKHLRTHSLLQAMNSKYAPRPASGKFVTLYPRDEAEFERCASELDRRLAGYEGPYILTDCRWGDGPVHFRYGAFTERWCWTDDGAFVPAFLGPDGQAVPDLRRPVFEVPEGITVPAFLRPHIARRESPSGDFGFEIKEAMHFSNAGGVYDAVRKADGRRVVLKEARPHAGVDPDGNDAVARLEREKRILERLETVPGVPQAYGMAGLGGHRMLVMQHMEGMTLQRWVALNHPLLTWEGNSPAGIRAYTRRIERIYSAAAAIVDRIHAEGVVFGDLHPGNVLIAEDVTDPSEYRISFIDFEMAFLAAEDLRPSLGHPGFTAKRKTGIAVDDHALAVLRLWFYLPTAAILGVCPDKADSLIDDAIRLFAPPEDFARTVRDVVLSETDEDGTQAARGVGATAEVAMDTPAADWPAVCASMVRAINATASTGRADRLFPGDPQQFSEEPGSFAHGAAGVLWALSVAAGERRAEYEEWLLRAARSEHVRAGFYDGAHGIAHVLDHLGHRAEAEDLIERVRPVIQEMTDVSVYGGLAGAGLNLLHLANGDAGHSYLKEARELATRITEAITDGGPHRIDRTPGELGTKGGLLRGWSGVALFLLRLYEATGEDVHLRNAVRALHRDLDLCVPNADGALHVNGGYRSLAYLEIGAAGVALIADLVSDCARDDRLDEAVPRLALATRAAYVIETPLFSGRAGLMAAAHALRRHLAGLGADPVQEHLDNLHWNALSYDGEVAFPGRGSLRLSMDLATGNAGILTAMSYVTGGHHPLLPFLGRQRISGS